MIQIKTAMQVLNYGMVTELWILTNLQVSSCYGPGGCGVHLNLFTETFKFSFKYVMIQIWKFIYALHKVMGCKIYLTNMS